MGHGGMSWPSFVLSPLRSLRAFAQRTVSRFRLLSRFRSSLRGPFHPDFPTANRVQAEEGVRVLEVLFDGPRAVGVRIQKEDGTQDEVRAKVIVDADRVPGRRQLLLYDPGPLPPPVPSRQEK